MSQSVANAARWLAEQSDPPRPILPALRQRFDLSIAEAISAIREANSLRATNSKDMTNDR